MIKKNITSLNKNIKFNKCDWQSWLQTVREFYKEGALKRCDSQSSCSYLEFLLYKKDNDNRPYVNALIYNKTFPSLIDTGANISLFGSGLCDLVSQFNIKIKNDELSNISTADGKLQNVLGYIETPITVGNISKVVTFYLILSVIHDVILGMDFLKIFNIKIDFGKFAIDINSVSLAVVNTIQDVSHLSSKQKGELDLVIEKLKNISPTDRLGRTHLLTHFIDTGDAPPFKQRQYPLPQALQQKLKSEIDNMLKLNIIQESKSSFCSPV